MKKLLIFNYLIVITILLFLILFNCFIQSNKTIRTDDSANNYQDFVSGRINKTFICAYFVSK